MVNVENHLQLVDSFHGFPLDVDVENPWEIVHGFKALENPPGLRGLVRFIWSDDLHEVPGLVNIQKAIEHGPVEIVSFPMKNGDFPWLCDSLPEGI